jgi:hypothetical protein
MAAFLLYPLAVWQLGGRAIHHLHTALNRRKAP